ncbi:hypothetical protein GCM10023195_77100 [Actinoallomurus liliacearum]|uniref:DUF202 domain-containing protein n=1 Tax=Actinoallomurus liliacearum TaxID=1080073 RepID=A0ABP8TZ90_9ACTN
MIEARGLTKCYGNKTAFSLWARVAVSLVLAVIIVGYLTVTRKDTAR